VLKDTLRNDEL